MFRAITIAGVMAMTTLVGDALLASANAQGYGYSCRNGRSTDPNCYRGPRGVYVCGPCRERGEWRRHRRSYNCQDGRSTDPNCYRRGGYVCGPCYD